MNKGYKDFEKSTAAAESVRQKAAEFLNAETDEIIFTSGATDSLNLVASGFALPRLAPGKKAITTQLEEKLRAIPQVTVLGGIL